MLKNQRVQQAERQLLMETLRQHPVKANAAAQLGVNRTTLWRKLKKHGIKR